MPRASSVSNQSCSAIYPALREAFRATLVESPDVCGPLYHRYALQMVRRRRLVRGLPAAANAPGGIKGIWRVFYGDR